MFLLVGKGTQGKHGAKAAKGVGSLEAPSTPHRFFAEIWPARLKKPQRQTRQKAESFGVDRKSGSGVETLDIRKGAKGAGDTWAYQLLAFLALFLMKGQAKARAQAPNLRQC